MRVTRNKTANSNNCHSDNVRKRQCEDNEEAGDNAIAVTWICTDYYLRKMQTLRGLKIKPSIAFQCIGFGPDHCSRMLQAIAFCT